MKNIILRVSICSILLLISGIAISDSSNIKRVPTFNLPLLDYSGKVSIEDYKGKILLIDFWASWCTPCRESMPYFTDLKKHFPSDKFEILAINLDDKASDGKKFSDTIHINYPLLYAGSESDLPGRFGVEVMPSSFLIDENGKILLHHKGMKKKDKKMLTMMISQYVNKL